MKINEKTIKTISIYATIFVILWSKIVNREQ